jgi:crotonobetainyl-CoA:carnitine CoA-transferase CaiB-like acyl-CoA transferase
MLPAFTLPEAPRSWNEWTAYSLLHAAFAGVLAWLGANRGTEPRGFWLLWAVMAGAMLALLGHRALLLARHEAAESTTVDRVLAGAVDLTGLLLVVVLVVSGMF